MTAVKPRLSHRAAVSMVAALFLLASGCAAADSKTANQRGNVGQAKRGAAYQGQLVTLVLPRPSDRPTSYRPFTYGYEPSIVSGLIQTRDATEIVQAILMRELGAAGYQPLLAESADGGDELWIRYEITRVWTTQSIPGVWPASPPLYRTLITAHVSAFRGDSACFAQAYFGQSEAPSAWSAFSRALNRLLEQSLPELLNALSECGNSR